MLGSCLCGGVRFACDTVPMMIHCYCGMCRRAQGAAFGTFANVRSDAFRLLSGEDQIGRYESSPGCFRQFCRTCGSPLPVRQPGDEVVGVPAGLFDDDPGARPSLHLFVGSKAPWCEISDDLPQFERFVPGFGESESD